ncbi:MAG: carboxypeptidase regulatory-like domain-containing protein [Bryobacteraceae bacterium]|nr:carboxypeptidase regulatory-like domain-containing protein [Bryobacteraceae bacterium]
MRQKLLFALLAVVSVVTAQVNTSSVSGTVLDASSAGVAGAGVTLSNQETGVRLTATSGSAGNYLFPALQRGIYRLTVEAPGFKTFERSGLTLAVGDKIGVDVKLELGNVTEKIEVTAETPLLTTTNASLGQVIDNRKIMELPLPGRDPARLVQLAPGVGGRDSNLGDLRLGGGRTRLVEFYVDGSPTSAVSDARSTALPSIDAIEEFKVETNNLSAEYGRLSGGAINIQTKAGTNQWHGSLYEFGMSDIFNARDWDSNRRGASKAAFQRHLFGGTIGGPVMIPKLYNGRNRSFFFFNFDGERQNQEGLLRLATMPTALERAGDFSQTLNTSGQKVTVYDPTTYNPATNSRTPFANNQIPSNRFDPVSRYMLSLWPLPNRPGDPGNGVNNFAGQSSSESQRNDITARFDQNFGSSQRLYVRLTRKNSQSLPNYWAGPATSGVRPSWETQTGSTVSYNWTVRPTFLVSAQFGAAPRDSTYYPVFDNFDPTQIPFAANAKRELDPRFIPNMNFEKVSGLGVNFQTTWLRDRYFFGNLSATKIWSRHTVKFGYEQRKSYLNNNEAGTPSGGANFDGRWTGVNYNAAFAQQGSGFASYLLGLPNNFNFDGNKFGWAVLFANHALFVQDDYKVSNKLTLNLGLRWEYEAPETERFNRLIYSDYGADMGFKVRSDFNFQRDVIATGLLPAGSPAPNLSGPFLGGIGVVASPTRSERGNSNSQWKNFGPRLGLAYALDAKTVLRSGFGILYSGFTGNASGAGSLSMQTYFNSTGSAIVTRDNGATPAVSLSNPFPADAGLFPGTNDPAEIIRRYMGNSSFGYAIDQRPSYEISYNLGLQRQIGKWVAEASFVGNRGVHLYVGGNPLMSTLDPPYLSLGTVLDRNVPNPFFGTLAANNNSVLNQPTVAYKYLLMPYPHLAGGTRILQRSTGNSTYTGGFFRLERRYSSGISLLLSYTVSKLIEDTAAKTGTQYGLPQDGKTFKDIRGISVQDIPQKLVATYLYDLPFGKGKRWLGSPSGAGGRVADAVVGGWKVSGFTVIQSGYPLQVRQTDNFIGGLGYGNLRPTLVGNYVNDNSVSSAVGFPAAGKPRYLNLEAFQTTPRFQFGSVPHVLPNLRQPRFNQTDFSVMKNFNFTEKSFLQIRLESTNFFNHPVFQLDANAQNVQRAEFGYLQSLQNSPRTMQFGARFVF